MPRRNARSAQVRHLTDLPKRKLVEKRYGKIAETIVLYRGQPRTAFGVSYRNVNDYLKSL